jgi:hypothetical protein
MKLLLFIILQGIKLKSKTNFTTPEITLPPAPQDNLPPPVPLNAVRSIDADTTDG